MRSLEHHPRIYSRTFLQTADTRYPMAVALTASSCPSLSCASGTGPSGFWRSQPTGRPGQRASPACGPGTPELSNHVHGARGLCHLLGPAELHQPRCGH
ncbi:Melatonin receptor type 1B [Manis javanica]|nr:Melatonin receptor type 1B [Manis javanica]